VSDVDLKWLTEQTIRIVLAATELDSEAAAMAFCEVGERYGSAGAYSTCCALAEAIVRMGDHREDGDGFYGFEVQHIERGPLAPEEVDEDAQDVMQAMRFVTAYLNRDVPQQLALFHAAETPEDAIVLPIGLIKLVSAYGRHKLASGDGGERNG
jgi:hypothetical protein